MSKDQNTEPTKIRKYALWIILIIAILSLNYWYLNKYLSSNTSYITAYQLKEDELAKYRNPAVAGLFYSSLPTELSSQLDNYLQSGVFIKYSSYQPKILIVPHAGYMYSAETAAKAYAILQKHKSSIKNVILLGPSHYYGGDGAYLSDADYFATPLGKVAVNKEFVKKIVSSCSNNIKINNQAHVKEHSIEVQLPFIQKVLPQASIIPIVYGNVDVNNLFSCIKDFLVKPDTILIVSADLSHYHTYEQAQIIDADTAQKVSDKLPIEDHASCGAIGINTAIMLSKLYNYRPQMLELVNSGDISGDKSRVVGYGAWSFYPDSDNNKSKSELEQEVENLENFAKTYGKVLMQIVHLSLEKAVKHNKHYSPSRANYPEDIFDKGASFVTLRKKGELRGCIGSILPNSSIAQDIASNTYLASKEDSRFSPITEDELKEIKYSISLLSGFEKIPYKSEQDLLNKIKQGIDGIVIRDGDRQGVFLPSVWSELPDKTEFFKQLKVKAGMNPNYWNNRIKVYRFRTVEIKNAN